MKPLMEIEKIMIQNPSALRHMFEVFSTLPEPTPAKRNLLKRIRFLQRLAAKRKKMKPRWQLSEKRIIQILEMFGLEVQMWDVEDGVFLGAIVDGYKPDWFSGFECKKCGWKGTDLEESGCVTYGDTWYVCPQCKSDAYDTISKRSS